MGLPDGPYGRAGRGMGEGTDSGSGAGRPYERRCPGVPVRLESGHLGRGSGGPQWAQGTGLCRGSGALVDAARVGLPLWRGIGTVRVGGRG